MIAFRDGYGAKVEKPDMKIAFVIDRFLPNKGGGERYLEMLARQLTQQGHKVTILARRFPPGKSLHPNVDYHPISTPPWPGWVRLLFFAYRCHAAANEKGFDLVHDLGHTWGADVFNPHGGVEQVWLNRYFSSYRHPLHRFFKKLQRLCSPKEWVMLLLQRKQYLSPDTRRVIAISPMIVDHIHTFYPRLPPKKLTLVQNPADLTRFSPKNREKFRDVTRTSLGLGKNDLALLFAGNNFRLKGLFPLLYALKLLSESPSPPRLLVAGHEPPRRWKRFCRTLGIDDLVSFLGAVREMERLYAAADIFVLPAYYDSAPLVVLEALASGLPVITSRWAGTSSAIKSADVGAILQDNDNPTEIAQAIRSFFPEEKRQNALQAAPKAVHALSIEDHVAHLLEIYHGIMREKEHG